MISWVLSNMDIFALAGSLALLSFDLFDGYARYIWWVHIKRNSPLRELVEAGRPSKEHLGHFTFRLHTQRFEIGPIEGWAQNERPGLWYFLVRETLPSRLRRRFTLAKAPEEMDFVEVAHRRITPPQPGHIASYTADRWATAVLRRTGFYRVIINTNREGLSPGSKVTLHSGATIVKMGVRYINEDNAPSGNVTLDT